MSMGRYGGTGEETFTNSTMSRGRSMNDAETVYTPVTPIAHHLFRTPQGVEMAERHFDILSGYRRLMAVAASLTTSDLADLHAALRTGNFRRSRDDEPDIVELATAIGPAIGLRIAPDRRYGCGLRIEERTASGYRPVGIEDATTRLLCAHHAIETQREIEYIGSDRKGKGLMPVAKDGSLLGFASMDGNNIFTTGEAVRSVMASSAGETSVRYGVTITRDPPRDEPATEIKTDGKKEDKK
jgi:hypothetical protein